MIIGIDPKVDYAFKHMLGRDATRPILIDMIDSVLNPPPGRHIQEIELLNPFNPKEAFHDKLSILDIKARDQSGRHLNVEMQLLPYRSYEKRVLYYWSRLYHQQLQQGEDYYALNPTISISFLDHVLIEGTSDHHLRFRLLEETRHLPLTEDLDFHFLQLPNFTKSAAELTSGLDIWLYFLQNAEKMDTEQLPQALQKPLVVRALEELKMLTQDELERERYESRRKAQLDYNTGLKSARMEGRLEGEKIGRIHAFEGLLGRALTPFEELAALPLADLSRFSDQLEAEVHKQSGS